MSDFSDEMAATALESITEFGELATFTRKTIGEYSTETMSNTSTETNYSVYVLIYDFDLRQVDGQTILSTDKQCLCPTTDSSSVAFEPKVGDILTAGSKEFRVNEINDPVSLNGESVVYQLKIGV